MARMAAFLSCRFKGSVNDSERNGLQSHGSSVGVARFLVEQVRSKNLPESFYVSAVHEGGILFSPLKREDESAGVIDGKVSTVRYEAVNAMLLNEFLKEHRRLEEQRSEFEAKFAQQQKQIETLSAGVQTLREQVELSRSMAQLADYSR